ncbi:MAG: hypothetical protein RhofKO_34530 [Rhodothermales bacterium]
MCLLLGSLAPVSKAQFSSATVIDDEATGAQSVYAADMDGDGDLDVLSAALDRRSFVWYPNTDGQGTFGAPRFIADNTISPRLMHAADLDGDGDLDVLTSAGTFQFAVFAEVRWYRNTDGQGTFESVQEVYDDDAEVGHITTGDVDGDGDLDVLLAGSFTNELVWFENTDGLGSFGPKQELGVGGFPAFIGVTDVDQDGDADVVAVGAHQGAILWFEQTEPGVFGTRQIANTEITGADNLSGQLADVNGDGIMDMVTGAQGGNEVAWFPGTGTASAFGAKQSIGIATEVLDDINSTDLDGDGDLDVLTASRDGMLSWYVNTDGAGTFSMARLLISTPNRPPNFVRTADLDQDGDQDVLTASASGQLVLWYANDGVGVHVESPHDHPAQFTVERVYPNPFTQRLNVTIQAAQSGPVHVDVYDMLGRHVTQLANGIRPEGAHEVVWQSSGIPAGMYILRILANGQRYSLPVVRK